MSRCRVPCLTPRWVPPPLTNQHPLHGGLGMVTPAEFEA